MICLAIYPTLIQFFSFVYLIIWFFINIYSLGAMFYFLSVSTVLLATVFNLLSIAIYCLLSVSTTFSAVGSSIRVFRLYQIIPQDLLAMLKVYQIILLASNYLDLIIYIELARFLTTLNKSPFKPYGFKAEIMQLHLQLLLLLQQQEVETEVYNGEAQLYCIQLVMLPTTIVALSRLADFIQKLQLGSKKKFAYTYLAIHNCGFNSYLIYKQLRTWLQPVQSTLTLIKKLTRTLGSFNGFVYGDQMIGLHKIILYLFYYNYFLSIIQVLSSI